MGAWKTNLPFKWHGNCVPVSLSHRLQALRAKICCLNIQHYLLGSQLSLTLNNESNIRLAHEHIEAMVGLSYFRWKSRNTSERITFPVRFYISFYFEKKKQITFYSYFIHFISVNHDTWSVARPKIWAELLGFYVNHMFRSY